MERDARRIGVHCPSMLHGRKPCQQSALAEAAQSPRCHMPSYSSCPTLPCQMCVEESPIVMPLPERLSGFVGCSARLKSLLVSRGRPGIYSTALPAPAAAAAIAALEVATPRLRATLRRNVFVFRAAIGIDHGDDTQSQRRPPHLQIKQEGWFGMKGDPMECAPVSYPNHVTKAETRPFDADTCSPIVPILVGSEHAALAASERLEHMGYLVPAIRPPTVPAGTARLRVALSAAHTVDEIEGFARALRQTGVLSPECGL